MTHKPLYWNEQAKHCIVQHGKKYYIAFKLADDLHIVVETIPYNKDDTDAQRLQLALERLEAMHKEVAERTAT